MATIELLRVPDGSTFAVYVADQTFYAAISRHGLLSRLFLSREAARAEAKAVSKLELDGEIVSSLLSSTSDEGEAVMHECETPFRYSAWIVEVTSNAFEQNGFLEQEEAVTACRDHAAVRNG